MKNITLLLTIFILGFTACVDDEDLKEPISTGPSGSPIIINEVMSAGDPDWLELHNTSSEPVDISGYVVSDPGADYEIPAGITMDGKGYLVLLADSKNTVDVDGIHTSFKISSTSGELLRLTDDEGNLVDEVDVPKMNAGITWARVFDGAENWDNLTPSPNAANSNENFEPTLTADSIPALDDNVRFEYTVNAADATGIRDVKLFLKYNGDLQFVDMAPVGDGDFSYILPQFTEGQEVEYYVVVSDNSGLQTFFPESAPDDPLVLTVENGYPIFLNLELSSENPADGEGVTFTAEVIDASGFDDIRLYYVLNDQIADDKERISMTDLGNDKFEATIPGQVNNTVVRYYLRAEDLAGQKTYFPLEVDGGDFDHDFETTWPFYTVSPPVILEALVINEILGSGSPDYIELYNGTSAAIDLGGYKLHDSDPTEAYTIPPSTMIPAGGFWVLDADGDATTQFKVSSGGEDITLLDPSDNVVDQLLKDNWPEGHDASVGRIPDGAEKWSILSEESKGTTNGN
jgi:hypothetical protein